MSSGTLVERSSVNMREDAMVLPSSSSAQSVIEVKKPEMDCRKKNILQEITVADVNGKRKPKKGNWLKNIGWKKINGEKKVQAKDVTVKTIDGIQDERNGVPSVHVDGIVTAVTVKDGKRQRDKDNKKVNHNNENDKNKGKKRSFLKKLTLNRKKNYKDAEKEITARTVSERECKEIERYGGCDGPISSMVCGNAKDVEPSRTMRLEVDTLVPSTSHNKKTKKTSWLKKLRFRRKRTSGQDEKKVTLRMASESKVMENDAENVPSVSGQGEKKAPTRKVGPSRKVKLVMDTLISTPGNEEELGAEGLACLQKFQLGDGAIRSEGLRKGRRIRRKGLEDKKTEIVKHLPQTLTPFMKPGQGKKTELMDMASSSNILGEHQERASAHRCVWIFPQIENVFTKHTPPGQCLRFDFTEFCDLFVIILLPIESSNQAQYSLSSICQGQSNSENFQASHLEPGICALWNIPRILTDQLCSGRAVLSGLHTMNDINIFVNSDKNSFHAIRISEYEKGAGANTSAFVVDQFNSRAVKGQSAKCVRQLQLQRDQTCHFYVCGSSKENTIAVIAQMVCLVPGTFPMKDKRDKTFTHAKKMENFASITWNLPEREIFPNYSHQDLLQISIMCCHSEPSVYFESLPIFQNAFGSIGPTKMSKRGKLRLPAASRTSSFSEISSTTDVIADECNFTQICNSAPSKPATTGQRTIENLLLNAYVEYLEKQTSLLMETVNGLKLEKEKMNSINDELQEENRKLRTLLQGRMQSDVAKEGIKFKEESLIHSQQRKKRSKINFVKDTIAILEETASVAISKNPKEKYGQTSKLRSYTEIPERKSNSSTFERNDKLSENTRKWPDSLGLTSTKGVEGKVDFEGTHAEVITPTKPMTDKLCTEGAFFLIPEQNSLSAALLDKTETVFEAKSTETMDDIEEMIWKELSCLNKNLDAITAPTMTKIKIYYTLFNNPKKENDSLGPLKITIRNELERLKKHSEYMLELRHIIEDLVQENEGLQFPGKSLLHITEDEKGRLKNVFPTSKDRVHGDDCKIQTTGKVSSKSSSVHHIRDSQSTGNTHCRDTYISKGKETVPKRKSAHSERRVTDCPLTANGKHEERRTYPRRIFRQSKKTPFRGSSQKFVN